MPCLRNSSEFFYEQSRIHRWINGEPVVLTAEAVRSQGFSPLFAKIIRSCVRNGILANNSFWTLTRDGFRETLTYLLTPLPDIVSGVKPEGENHVELRLAESIESGPPLAASIRENRSATTSTGYRTTAGADHAVRYGDHG